MASGKDLDYMMQEEKKRKKVSGRGRSFLPVFIVLLCITIGGILGSVLYERAVTARNTPIFRYVSVSEEAAANAYIWLSQMEDMPLSYAEIKQLMGEIELEIVLTPTGEKGTYLQALSDGTFEKCTMQSREGLEKAYRKVAADRLSREGYETEASGEILDSLMQEAYGVSVSEYLDKCQIQLLPSLEELTRQYSGEYIEK